MAENNFQQLYSKNPSNIAIEILEDYVMPRGGRANEFLLRDIYFALEIENVNDKFLLCFHLASELDQ